MEGPQHSVVRDTSARIGGNNWVDIFRYLRRILFSMTMNRRHYWCQKFETLSDHLRPLPKQYWMTRTHLTVDETIQRFLGRTSETVNIPS